MMKKIYYLFVLLILAASLPAQPPKVSFEHLNMRNGLPGEFVSTILQDEKGYIWFANARSITRYDGYRFKNYPVKVKGFENTLNENVPMMFMDKNKTLWVATYGNNIFRYNPALDSLVLEKMGGNRIGEGYYTGFYFDDRENNIWSLTAKTDTDFYLERYNPKLKSTTTYSRGMKGNQLFAMQEGKSLFVTPAGDVMIGGNNGFLNYDFKESRFTGYLQEKDSLNQLTIGGIYREPAGGRDVWLLANKIKDKKIMLYRYSLETKVLKACLGLPGSFMEGQNPIFQDKKGRLWLVTKSGFFLYDKALNQKTDYLFPANDKDVQRQSIHDVLIDNKNTFWISTTAGLLNFTPGTGQFQRYRANQSDPYALGHIHVTRLFEDRSGLIWVGMDEYGVDRITTLHAAFSGFKNNPEKPGSYPENVTGVVAKPDGDYWVATQRGLFNWDVKKSVFNEVVPPGKKAGTYIISAVMFACGTLCFFDNDGLNFYTPGHKLKTIAMPGDEGVGNCYVDRQNGLWLLTSKGKLYKLNDARTAFDGYAFTTRPGQAAKKDDGNDINTGCIYQDAAGAIWVASSKTGLCRVDTAKKQAIISPVMQGKVFNDAILVFEDKEGNFWIGTASNGFWQFDRKTEKLVKEVKDDGEVLSQGLRSIEEDKSGNLWIAGLRGLVKYNYHSGIVLDFTIADNIPLEVPGTMLKKASGEMVLPMFNSVLLFNPDDITSNPVAPQVQVENIMYSDPKSSVNNGHTVNVFTDSSLTLPYNLNRITFNYVALHFVNPAQNKYAYMLENYDKQWIQAQTQRSVTYNNLAPGTYIFRVKAANSDGVWNNTGASYTIVILSPWWSRWWAWVLYVLVFGLAVYGFIYYRSRQLVARNKMLEKRITVRTHQLSEANEELQAKQEEVTLQRDQLAQAFDELKTTQTQLIQSEKMASLGELTAGIAHEIQNPLNFVNNFSEVNMELVDELLSEKAKGKTERDEQLEDGLLADIKQNLEKINHHGKRADFIVKGMLQHSRTSTGERQPTNINVLANEFFKLSYHGLRAKDKTFNAELITKFDDTIPNINIVQQDIGRVLLNLFNNAFYATAEKKKRLEIEGVKNLQGLAEYRPTVTVSTKLSSPPSGAGGLVISVIDNGIGIPQTITDKIFQPFFTTKPTGEGTGLGLSLSYDIVVKGHGGNITVESKEGEGSEFTVWLPVR